jgi:hypothetical protein
VIDLSALITLGWEGLFALIRTHSWIMQR